MVIRSRKVVPDELVTLMSWDFLIFLMMVGWKEKVAVKDRVVAFIATIVVCTTIVAIVVQTSHCEVLAWLHCNIISKRSSINYLL